jgi:hypothetical protein
VSQLVSMAARELKERQAQRRIPARLQPRTLIFHVPFAQSQVSRGIKLVDDWLQSVRADSPARRARRSLTVGPSRNEPSVPGTGKRMAFKEVDDYDN